jgi:hypothetical protein
VRRRHRLPELSIEGAIVRVTQQAGGPGKALGATIRGHLPILYDVAAMALTPGARLSPFEIPGRPCFRRSTDRQDRMLDGIAGC